MSEPAWDQFLNHENKRKLAAERKQAADTIATLTKERDDAWKEVVAALKSGEVAQRDGARWQAVAQHQGNKRDAAEKEVELCYAQLAQERERHRGVEVELQKRIAELEAWVEKVRRENWQPPAAPQAATRAQGAQHFPHIPRPKE